MMNTLLRDPIINAINNGIKQPIELVISNKYYQAAIILIFAGIDAMSHLNRAEEKKFGDPNDFKGWMKKYFHLSGETEIAVDEWWAARNAIIHTFGIYSKAHQKGKTRALRWMNKSVPHIRYNPKVASHLILVDVIAMKDAFFNGINKFLTESFADPKRKNIMEKRLKELLIGLPVKKE